MGVVKDGTRLSCASASERSSNACTNSARFKLGLSSSSSRSLPVNGRPGFSAAVRADFSSGWIGF